MAEVFDPGISDFRITKCQRTESGGLLQQDQILIPCRSLIEQNSIDFHAAVEFFPSVPVFAGNGLQKLGNGHSRIHSAPQSIDCISNIDDRGIASQRLQCHGNKQEQKEQQQECPSNRLSVDAEV